jgi:HEAT repeat protein
MRTPAVVFCVTSIAGAVVIGFSGTGSAVAPAVSQTVTPGQARQEREVTPAQVKAAIDRLGTVDFAVRSGAARTVRRATAAVAVPALLHAVAEHADGYVRFRALVVLSGFNDPRTREVMAGVLDDPNDRLRTVAYNYFEHNTDAALLPRLLEALTREESEFVRPSLTRALAAHGADPRASQAMAGLVMKGQDLFRSAVIDALGDYHAAYAIAPITEVAKTEGPLQDDAALALGKIGDKRSLEVLAALQRSAPRNAQPAVAASICLLGVNCASHQKYLTDTLRFAIAASGFQDLLRSTASSLAAVAVGGHEDAAATLIAMGAPTRDPARAAIVLALGTVALRNTPLLMKVLEGQADMAPAMELLRESFDMLEEDFEEERFYVAIRRAYWAAPEGSTARKVAEALIQKLEF